MVATGQGLRRRVRYAEARPGGGIALTSYGYNSKLTIKVNSKLLTPYGILGW